MPQIIEASMSQLLRVLVGVRVCFCGRSHTILAVSLTQQYKEQRTFFTYRWAKDPLYNNRKQKRGRWRKSDWGCVPAWLGHVSHRRFSREPTDHLVRVCAPLRKECTFSLAHTKAEKSGQFTMLEIWAAPGGVFIGGRNDHIMRGRSCSRTQAPRRPGHVDSTPLRNSKKEFPTLSLNIQAAEAFRLFGLLNCAHRPAYILCRNDAGVWACGQLSHYRPRKRANFIWQRHRWWIANHETIIQS